MTPAPPTREVIHALVRVALDATQADEVQVFVGAGRVGLLDLRDGFEAENRAEAWGVVEVRARTGGAVGVARTGRFDEASVRQAARFASDAARVAPVKRALRPLPDPVARRESTQFDPQVAALPPAGRAALVTPLVLAARRHDLALDVRLAARAGSLGLGGQPGVLAMANSRGLFHFHRTTRIRLDARLRGPLCAAEIGSEHWLLRAFDPLQGLERVVARARLRTEVKAPPPPGETTVVLEPAAVAAFVASLAPHFSAEAVARGQSFVRGRQGRAIARGNITLRDDYAHPWHGAPPFDGDGQPRSVVPLLDRGTVRALTYSREQAWREDVPPTGHAPIWPCNGDARPRHLVMEGEDRSVDDLIASVERGVLIADVAEHRVVDATRATCAGTTHAGTFWIESGRVRHALPALRYEMSAFDLLAHATMLSRAEKARGAVVPAIRATKFRLFGGAS